MKLTKMQTSTLEIVAQKLTDIGLCTDHGTGWGYCCYEEEDGAHFYIQFDDIVTIITPVGNSYAFEAVVDGDHMVESFEVEDPSRTMLMRAVIACIGASMEKAFRLDWDGTIAQDCA